MTREEFAELQLRHQKSGRTLKEHLRETGLCYSTYNYWRKKYLAAEEPHELAHDSVTFQARFCNSFGQAR